MGVTGPPGVQAGGCCAGTTPTCNSVGVTIHGCNSLPLPGAEVQLKSGSTVVSSGTTNSSGVVSLAYSTAGSYTVSATGPAGVAWWSTTPATQNLTLSCTGTPGTTLTLTPATGWLCRCSHCVDPVDNGTTRLPTLTDANGSYSLQWSSPDTAWVCCYTIAGVAIWNTTGPPGTFCVATAGTGTIAVGYALSCINASRWQLNQIWTSCNSASPYHETAGNCSNPVKTVPYPYQPSGAIQDTYATGGINFLGTTVSAPNACNASVSFSLNPPGCYVPGTVLVTF